MAVHHLPATEETWRVGVLDHAFPPVITIDSGDEVVLQTAQSWGDRVTPETTLEDITRFVTELFPGVGPHTVTGPIAIRGAQPGQVLRVDVISLTPCEHGWNLVLPGREQTGLLPDDFPDGRIRHFFHDLDAMTVPFLDGISLPLNPLLGILAVAPPDPGPHNTIPPGPFGGNIDIPDLSTGASIYLPVWRPSALFSTGDAHSRQGAGEVCLTAIETAMVEARLRFTVLEPTVPLALPYAETPNSWIAIGLHEDLLEASRMAVRSLIRLLGDHCEMPAIDAYQLCSIAADIVVSQVVNETRGVHVRLAKHIFE